MPSGRLETPLVEALLRRAGVTSPVTLVGDPIEGVHSVVVCVACADGQRFAVKVFKDEFALNMAKERRVLKLVEPLSVNTPLVVAADDSRELLPWVYLLLTDLGEVLSAELEAGMSRAQLLKFNRDLGVGLRQLHELKLDCFGVINGRSLGEHGDNTQFMLTLFDVMLNRFSELGGSEKLEWRVRDFVLAKSDLFASCEQAVLCHFDCHKTNIAVTTGPDGPTFAGLLDFGDAVAGDPLLDLAKAHYVARQTDRHTLAAMLVGYDDVRPDWLAIFNLYTLVHAIDGWNWFAGFQDRASLPTLERDIRLLTGASWRGAPRGFSALP